MHTTTGNKTELMTFFDSNYSFIDFWKLWKINNTKVKRCGNLYEVVTALNEKVIYTNLICVLINVGVNDTDENSGSAMCNMTDELTRMMWEKYPDLKIILSVITPRKDVKDLEVKLCNRLLHERAQHTAELHIARHSNLRHPDG